MAALAAGLWLMVPASAWGCPYSIRQSGFVVLKKQEYHVYCFVKDDTPDKNTIQSGIDEAEYLLTDSNVKAELINVDRQIGHDAMVYVSQLGTNEFPAFALVSPKEDVMRLRVPDEQPLSADDVVALLERVVSSPKRDEMREHIVPQWCVVLLVKGADDAENQRALAEAKTAIKEIKGKPTEMVLSIDDPPYLLVVDAKEPTEQIFLWSLGLTGDDPPRAKAVVLFGRGRQIGPVFAGENLTSASLLNVFYKIGSNCSCTSDPIWVSGPAIPLQWDEACRAEVRKRLHFDPDNPMVRIEIARIWGKKVSDLRRTGGFLGYAEGSFAPPVEAEGETTAMPPTVPFALAVGVPNAHTEPKTPPATFERRTAHMVLGAIAGLGVAVMLGGGILMLRNRKA